MYYIKQLVDFNFDRKPKFNIFISNFPLRPLLAVILITPALFGLPSLIFYLLSLAPLDIFTILPSTITFILMPIPLIDTEPLSIVATCSTDHSTTKLLDLAKI